MWRLWERGLSVHAVSCNVLIEDLLLVSGMLELKVEWMLKGEVCVSFMFWKGEESVRGCIRQAKAAVT